MRVRETKRGLLDLLDFRTFFSATHFSMFYSISLIIRWMKQSANRMFADRYKVNSKKTRASAIFARTRHRFPQI